MPLCCAGVVVAKSPRMRLGILFVMLAACSASSSSSEPEQGADPGPRSGLPSDTLATGLSDAQRETLCAWWGETLGVGRMQSCSECNGDACTDWDVAVSSQADCVEWLQGLQPACAATIEDAEDCAFAQQPDLCAWPTACDPFDGC